MKENKPRLLLLGRPGCHLCEEFAEAFYAHFSADAFDLLQTDVDSRPEWRERFGRVIPVLLDEAGDVLCRSFFSAEAVQEWIAQRHEDRPEKAI